MIWVLLALAAVVAPYLLGIKALVDSAAARSAVRRLSMNIAVLERRLALVEGSLGPAPSPTGLAGEAGSPAPTPEAATEPAAAAQPTQPAPAEAPPAPPVPAAAAVTARLRRLEQLLVENWLVWVGGLALALGGGFLVKFSIDQGWLIPIVRAGLGVLLGFALSGAAEWALRREGAAGPGRSYVPQALAAAGASTVFASLYAAHQLYGLLPSVLAFPLLALTAAGTVMLSLRHGPFVAALGLAGAFAVPLLVQSGEPHALPLFIYLALVSAGALAVLRHRDWNWLAPIWLGAVIVWVLLWLATGPGPDAPVVGGFLLVELALFAALRLGVPRIGFLAGVNELASVRIITRTAFWTIAATMILLAQASGFDPASLVYALLAMLFVLWFAVRDPALDDVLAIAGMLPALLLAGWALPRRSPPIESVLPAVPPEQVFRFAAVALVSAVVLGGVFTLLQRVARPGRWAALSAATPPVLLAIAYWRLSEYGFDIAWSGLALLLGALELGAASWVARRRTGAGEFEIALAAYAVGVLSATILAAVFALSNAWLTVALAVHLPALGWVDGRIRLPVLRHLALGVAAIVLVRLALNPEVLQYPMAQRPIFNWLLYGYGVPAAAFIVATRQFGGRADDLLVHFLEAGAVLFSVLLVTLELRHLFYGRIDAPLQSLARDATQAIVWLAAAWALLRLGATRSRPVLHWAGIVLFALATAQAVLWQAMAANPVITGASVGRLPVIDVLAVAYGAPAVLYGLIAYARRGPAALVWTARVLAVGFAFLWLTLEVRHGFRGENLSAGGIGEAEWYFYSLAWLTAAGICLAVSLYLQSEWLRRAALLGIGIVIGKVFLSDMAELAGVLRALSFLGLGGALVGIGYAYRHLRPLQPE